MPAHPESELPPPVIEVHNLVKEYRLGGLEGLRTLGRRMIGFAVPQRQQFRALDDVSMTIRRGEVVGIIGHNGAGKSTLLKLLCGITQPTSGTIKVNGRIAPLIEVGAGLVGEMTGRENIYLNATILGLSRAEITRKIDEIIEFSELEKFIDTPIKRYSSGMQVKLGFAIATSVDSEVLIVDEVLAVGDLNFQRKCLERMESLIKSSQRTVLVVGHNIRQLERICTRMVMLSKGQVLEDGRPGTVSNAYYEKSEEGRLSEVNDSNLMIKTGGVMLRKISVKNKDKSAEVSRIVMHDSIVFVLQIESDIDFPDVDVAIGFHTVDFLHVNTFNNTPWGKVINLKKGVTEVECHVPDVPLMPATYGIRVGVCDKFGRTIWYKENVSTVTITAGGRSRAKMPFQALVDVPAHWVV